jgi:hypothetical protein
MELFTKLFGDLLLFVYHCFDRIVIHGLYEGRGVNRFLEPCHNPLHRASPIARCAGLPPSWAHRSILGMKSPLLGRAEQSIPLPVRGAPLGARD